MLRLETGQDRRKGVEQVPPADSVVGLHVQEGVAHGTVPLDHAQPAVRRKRGGPGVRRTGDGAFADDDVVVAAGQRLAGLGRDPR